MNARIAIVQPWLPQYRLPFYSRLRDIAASRGVDVHVFYGDAPPEWRARSDTVSAPWAERLPTRALTIRGRSLMLKDVSAVRDGRYDLVILEQAVRNLETFPLALRPGGPPIAFWGHGRTYTESRSRIQERAKQWLTQRGSWFFAYTEGGRQAVADAGFPADKITVVLNSVDTSMLRSDLESITEPELAEFKQVHGLGSCVGLHLGALDEPKRVPFLLDSAARIHRADASFCLAVVGAGSEAAAVKQAATAHDFIRYLGPQFGRGKALALAASDVLLNPGRVGLVAVDSFASGVPIATTRWLRHAPEFEYLTPDVTALVTLDDSAAFAHDVGALLADRSRLESMRAACRAEASSFSVEAMASNFLVGIEAALADHSEFGGHA